MFTGFTAEVWIEPGQAASQGKIYREKTNGEASEGKVSLVLGAGNVACGPAALLAPDERNDVGGQILVGLDLFDLWQAVVLGIGLGVMSGRDPRAGIALSIGLWITWVVLGALIGALPTAPSTPV